MTAPEVMELQYNNKFLKLQVFKNNIFVYLVAWTPRDGQKERYAPLARPQGVGAVCEWQL